MKKWLKGRLRKWLSYSPVELANYQLDSLKVDELIYPDYDKELDFLAAIRNINDSAAFHKLIDKLVERQLEHSVEMADSWDMVLFDRATINGFILLKEEVEDLTNQYLSMTKPADTFDKHAIL